MNPETLNVKCQQGKSMVNGGGRLPLPRLATQARMALHLVSEALQSALVFRHAADRCLADIFHANRQLGARDRRVVNSTFYSTLRWWGWLRTFAPADFVKHWLHGAGKDGDESLLGSSAWKRCLAAANLLDCGGNGPTDVAFLWLKELGVETKDISVASFDAGVLQRASVLASLARPQEMAAFSLDALMPKWVREHLASDGSPSWQRLVEWLQKRPPVWLRCQTEYMDEIRESLAHDGIPTLPSSLLPDALQINSDGNVNLRNAEAFRNGSIEIQDLASQCVGLVCAPVPGQQWWDACAGAGGKTLQLAGMMKGKGTVLATDLRLYKLDELKLRARRAQFSNIRCKEWKGKPMPAFRNRFDGVLVDVPCSCSGTWRRNPGARWTTDEEDMLQFPPLQLQLLCNAADAVKPGGTLVYSTCSMLEDENRRVARQFLKSRGDFELVPFECPLTGMENDGCNQIWPWDGDCDAMFTAKFRRAK